MRTLVTAPVKVNTLALAAFGVPKAPAGMIEGEPAGKGPPETSEADPDGAIGKGDGDAWLGGNDGALRETPNLLLAVPNAASKEDAAAAAAPNGFEATTEGEDPSWGGAVADAADPRRAETEFAPEPVTLVPVPVGEEIPAMPAAAATEPAALDAATAAEESMFETAATPVPTTLDAAAPPAVANESDPEFTAEPRAFEGLGAVMVVVGVAIGRPGMPGIGKAPAALSGGPVMLKAGARVAGVIESIPEGDMTVATPVDTGIIFPLETLTH